MMRNVPTIYDHKRMNDRRARALQLCGCWPQDIIATSIEGREKVIAQLEAVCKAQSAIMQEHPQRYDYSLHMMAWKELISEREAVAQLRKRGFDRPAYQPSIVGL